MISFKDRAAAHSGGNRIPDREMKTPAERSRRMLESVRRHVEESIERDCTVEHVARHFFYHPKYLSQLFKKESGQPLSEFIASVRMERAKSLLLHTDEPVEAIALSLGFSSSQHFYKRFRQHMNTTPVRYRSQFGGRGAAGRK